MATSFQAKWDTQKRSPISFATLYAQSPPAIRFELPDYFTSRPLCEAAEGQEKANKSRTLRLETMEETRKACDDVEGLCPPENWTLASYKELLFLDFMQGARAGMSL